MGLEKDNYDTSVILITLEHKLTSRNEDLSELNVDVLKKQIENNKSKIDELNIKRDNLKHMNKNIKIVLDKIDDELCIREYK